MPLSLAESQAVNEIAKHLYGFLPGKPHPYADQAISFPGVARLLGISQYWTGGSKLPALTRLLESTLEAERGKFCDLILEVVRKGLIYRNNQKQPITREEIRKLNELILQVGFKIPDLWDPAFLNSLLSEHKTTTEQQENTSTTSLNQLKQEFLRISQLTSQERGYAFEKYLNGLFAFFGLIPRGAFRLMGEQIDGSFQIGTNVYLLEAKWQKHQIGQDELLVFREKVESKSTWSRGLFVSDSGFTNDGLAAFARGRSTNIIGMTGQDLFFILEGQMSLVEAINRKARQAAETGEFYISVYELMNEF
jgi:hypothetical protein